MSVLEVKNLTKSFDGLRALDIQMPVGFEAGEITSMIGPNGAGKTTLFNLINGFIKPDAGTILYRGKDITGLSPWSVARLGIGRLFQDVRPFQRLTVCDNVLSAFKEQRGENPLCSLFMRWKVAADEARLTEKTMGLLRFVGLADKADEPAENLSFGQQKLLSIARMLAADSDVLLLDEPTAGVNPQMVTTILDVMRKLASEGKTIVVIEHNMNVVLAISDWVNFMDEGQILAVGHPDEVLGNSEVRATYMGL